MSEQETIHFAVERANNCIWLRDLRAGTPTEIHMTPDQAIAVGKKLIAIGHGVEAREERKDDGDDSSS